jgi:Ca2+:H+ antiporter
MCFCAGGFRYSEQSFNMTAAQTKSSLLMIAVIALLLPAVFYYVLGTRTGPGAVVDAQAGATILKISHGVALLLLLSACFDCAACMER